MKFHQVAVGQRFEFEGKVYVKSRPLTAIHEASGQTQMIRRSANVTLPGERVAEPSAPQVLEAEAVRAAFEDFYAHCVACLQDMETEQNAKTLSAAHSRIERARKEFLETLCISS